MYEEFGLTEELRQSIIDEFGEINEFTIREFFNEFNEEVSKNIKDEVNKNKKETTKFMDKTKYLFFAGLLLGYGYVKFSEELDKEYEEYEKDIEKNNLKGYKFIADKIKKEEEYKYTPEETLEFISQINGLLSKFELDTTSTKAENDKYIRLIKNYYRETEKQVSYYQTDITLKEYLSKKVDKFDKLEKTVAYYGKDGTIRAYFDIASYDSMVYNTNLTRTGVRETLKACIRLKNDVVYVDPHPFACPECQIWQGRFYSLSGDTETFNGEKVIPLEVAIEGESGIGLLHPNCTHIPRPAIDIDEESDEYSGAEWEEKYDTRQKIQALELKKSRLRNDNKIYSRLDDEAAIDKNKQKIRSINKKIRELKQ